jgi:hypothetical protein
MMAFSLTWLPEVLEEAGLKVAEQPGWRTRGHGDVGTIRGVMCHHTAGPLKGIMPSLGIVTNGRPDLSGPLAQLCLGRDGTFFVIAAGRAYHAGVGNWRGITSGNSSFIGIEAENTGLIAGPQADPWPEVQLDAYRRGVAALLKKIQENESMCCGHKEYALPKGRKSDPTFDMDAFRQQVAAIMAGTAAPPTLIPATDTGGRPTLRRGARGDMVKQIQRKLGLRDDGIFGPGTEAALREFQRHNGLVPDGIVGPRTWAALDPTKTAVVSAGSGSGSNMPDDKFQLARNILINAIRPALNLIGHGGLAAEQLVLGTGIQESLLVHRQQLGGGPALGLFQMETATHNDCWVNFLNSRKALADKVRQTLDPGQEPAAQTMKVNDHYAAAMCRVRYLRVSEALPNAGDIPAMARYWKQYYNTPLGAGKPEQFQEKWPNYVNQNTFD